jgi:hypothetical protein
VRTFCILEDTMRDAEPRPAHRENSPDTLLGSLLVVEATLKILIAHLRRTGTDEQVERLLVDLCREVDALRRRGITTCFGTGEQDIRDGIEDAVAAILGDAARMTPPAEVSTDATTDSLPRPSSSLAERAGQGSQTLGSVPC